jgi:hypothetical protein
MLFQQSSQGDVNQPRKTEFPQMQQETIGMYSSPHVMEKLMLLLSLMEHRSTAPFHSHLSFLLPDINQTNLQLQPKQAQ